MVAKPAKIIRILNQMKIKILFEIVSVDLFFGSYMSNKVLLTNADLRYIIAL